MSTKTKRWLLVTAVWLIVVGLLGAIKFSQISAAIAFGASFPEPSETVITATATAAEYIQRTSVVGEVVPMRSVTLRNELAGAIVEVGFAPGQRVAAGQLLIRQDVSEELAMLAAANSTEALAQRTLDRNESLISGSAISRQAVDDALAQRDAARAQAQQIKAIIEKKTLRAPFAGATGLEPWEAGGYLSAGSTVTTLVGGGDDIWVDFSLPQQHASVALGSSVSISSDTIGLTQATIIARAPIVNAASRAVQFRALLKNHQQIALPGAIVGVSVATGEPQPALAVPAVALRHDTFGPHVFTLVPAEDGADAPLRATRRAVRVLSIEAETAYLALRTDGGLAAGETLAAQGAFKLRDGILVNLSSQQARDLSPP